MSSRPSLMLLIALGAAAAGLARPVVAEEAVAIAAPVTVTVGGYVEAAAAYNFNRPANGITALRGFDNRHATLAVTNAVLDVTGRKGTVAARVALQTGLTGATYYGGEPAALAAGGGVAPSDGGLWRHLQQAYVEWTPARLPDLMLHAGLATSPIGIEGIAVKDNWHFSRSDLFFGLPFYHTGAKATYALTPRLSAEAGVYNGWNTLVDNNTGKTVMAAVTFSEPDRLLAQLRYCGGVERPTGAAEGQPWRHLVDAYASWDVTPVLALAVQGDVGQEDGTFGAHRWAAVAGYVRFKAAPWLQLAARGDVFGEKVARSDKGAASAIFWPVSRVASGTLTLDLRPAEQLLVRLEGRHDDADGDAYFRRAAAGSGTADDPYVPDARGQDTLTLGVVAWF